MDSQEGSNGTSSGVATSTAPSLADAALSVGGSTTGSSAARANLHALTILDIPATKMVILGKERKIKPHKIVSGFVLFVEESEDGKFEPQLDSSGDLDMLVYAGIALETQVTINKDHPVDPSYILTTFRSFHVKNFEARLLLIAEPNGGSEPILVASRDEEPLTFTLGTARLEISPSLNSLGLSAENHVRAEVAFSKWVSIRKAEVRSGRSSAAARALAAAGSRAVSECEPFAEKNAKDVAARKQKLAAVKAAAAEAAAAAKTAAMAAPPAAETKKAAGKKSEAAVGNLARRYNEIAARSYGKLKRHLTEEECTLVLDEHNIAAFKRPKNLVAKRDLVLKTLDKKPAEMPANFKGATSICDLSGAEESNTANEMTKLRAELAFMKSQQLAAGVAASKVQLHAHNQHGASAAAPAATAAAAPQETQGKYQGTSVTTVGEQGSIIVQSLTLNITLGAGTGAPTLAPCAPAQPLVGAQPPIAAQPPSHNALGLPNIGGASFSAAAAFPLLQAMLGVHATPHV